VYFSDISKATIISFFAAALLNWFDINGFEQGQDRSIHGFY